MDAGTAYETAVAAWTARVERVGEDQWASATPCPDWDVRGLVNHVVGEDLWTEPLMRGATIEEVGDRLDGDLLGDDPLARARAAAAQAVAAVEDTFVDGGTVHLSYGEERMEEYVAQLTADHLLHAWDLAAATGGDRGFDDGLVQHVAAWFVDREELYRGAGLIGPRVGSAGGDAMSGLLGASGRDPAWGR